MSIAGIEASVECAPDVSNLHACSWSCQIRGKRRTAEAGRGGEPLTGTVDDLDVLAKAAAAGEKLCFPVSAWMLDSSCSGPALDRTQHTAGNMMTLPSLTAV